MFGFGKKKDPVQLEMERIGKEVKAIAELRQKINKSKLGRDKGVTYPTIQKVLNGDLNTNIDTLRKVSSSYKIRFSNSHTWLAHTLANETFIDLPYRDMVKKVSKDTGLSESVVKNFFLHEGNLRVSSWINIALTYGYKVEAKPYSNLDLS